MLAEASMMAKHQDLAKEEMRLKFEEMRLLQQKQRVHLETEIAKVEAEEKVCTEFAKTNEEYCNWEQSEMAQKSIENEAVRLRKSNKSKVIVPTKQLNETPLMQPNSATSQLQPKCDGELFSKSSMNPCAPSWYQPVETESLQNLVNPEPLTVLAPSKFAFA